jgi:regulator of nucleoside diphosphate kinase
MNAPNIRPPIIVAEKDHERLSALALARLDRDAGAGALLAELERAQVVSEPEAQNAAGMHSRVDFIHNGATYRGVRLVYPGEADFTNGFLSVVSHVGAMLLGLSAGQSITWTGPDGRDHSLEVIAVAYG